MNDDRLGPQQPQPQKPTHPARPVTSWKPVRCSPTSVSRHHFLRRDNRPIRLTVARPFRSPALNGRHNPSGLPRCPLRMVNSAFPSCRNVEVQHVEAFLRHNLPPTVRAAVVVSRRRSTAPDSGNPGEPWRMVQGRITLTLQGLSVCQAPHHLAHGFAARRAEGKDTNRRPVPAIG